MLCSWIFFFTLIAFIVFYFKKRNARKKAGENYKSDERYLAVSKKKKNYRLDLYIILCGDNNNTSFSTKRS